MIFNKRKKRDRGLRPGLWPDSLNIPPNERNSAELFSGNDLAGMCPFI